jgi:hypothetical protein
MNVGDWFVAQNGSLYKVTEISEDSVAGDFYRIAPSPMMAILSTNEKKNKYHVLEHFFPIDSVSKRNYFKALLK